MSLLTGGEEVPGQNWIGSSLRYRNRNTGRYRVEVSTKLEVYTTLVVPVKYSSNIIHVCICNRVLQV